LIHETVKQFLEKSIKTTYILNIKRWYTLVRTCAGETVEIGVQKNDQFEITRIDLPEIDFRVVCSKGTYIRSLAYDLVRNVNSGSHQQL
jgi:tRNA pseudouridine55 synthase